MASEFLTACLDLLETGSDLAAKIPARPPKENHPRSPVAKPIARTSAADVAPRWVLASRRWFKDFSNRHILSIIFGTWALLVALSFATSLLVSFFTLQAAVFAGAMVFDLTKRLRIGAGVDGYTASSLGSFSRWQSCLNSSFLFQLQWSSFTGRLGC
jgi:hypothetical protein